MNWNEEKIGHCKNSISLCTNNFEVVSPLHFLSHPNSQAYLFQLSLVLGGAVMAVHMIFSGFLVLKKDVQPWLNWIFDIIFLNHANNGMLLAVFGYDREKLDCEDIYCHYKDPKVFLQLIEAPTCIAFRSLFVIFCIVHVLTYVNVMLKMKRISWTNNELKFRVRI